LSAPPGRHGARSTRRHCECRKPGRALVDRAAQDLGLDPQRSFVVGDTWLDIGLARASGARGVLVRTGAGAIEEARPKPDLKRGRGRGTTSRPAVSWILLNRQLSPQSAIRDPQC